MSGETVAVFNGEKMTRREIEIAREAFMRGGQFAFSKIREARIGVDYNRDGEWIGLVPEAARRFPLPTITRPRVVRVCSKEYRISGRRIEFRVPCGGGESCGHGEWADCQRWQASTRSLEEVGALSDLIAQPNETVSE